MRNPFLVLGAVAMLSLPALAEWNNLDGQPMPPIAAKAWLNVKKAPSAADLRGKVYLLEFFSTT